MITIKVEGLPDVVLNSYDGLRLLVDGMDLLLLETNTVNELRITERTGKQLRVLPGASNAIILDTQPEE